MLALQTVSRVFVSVKCQIWPTADVLMSTFMFTQFLLQKTSLIQSLFSVRQAYFVSLRVLVSYCAMHDTNL
jgi:hypothetical protein